MRYSDWLFELCLAWPFVLVEVVVEHAGLLSWLVECR